MQDLDALIQQAQVDHEQKAFEKFKKRHAENAHKIALVLSDSLISQLSLTLHRSVNDGGWFAFTYKGKEYTIDPSHICEAYFTLRLDASAERCQNDEDVVHFIAKTLRKPPHASKVDYADDFAFATSEYSSSGLTRREYFIGQALAGGYEYPVQQADQIINSLRPKDESTSVEQYPFAEVLKWVDDLPEEPKPPVVEEPATETEEIPF